MSNLDFIQTIGGQDYSKILKRALDNDGDIVDLGCYSWDWSNIFIGKKRVIGADPIEKSIPNNTELFNGVLGASNGKVIMTLKELGSSINPNLHKEQLDIIEVNMITWKAFCAKYNIDKISVLKINIEGSEYQLLNSMDSSDFEKIDQIAISFHDWYVPQWKKLTEASIYLLKSYGFELIEIQNDCNWYLAYKPNL